MLGFRCCICNRCIICFGWNHAGIVLSIIGILDAEFVSGYVLLTGPVAKRRTKGQDELRSAPETYPGLFGPVPAWFTRRAGHFDFRAIYRSSADAVWRVEAWLVQLATEAQAPVQKSGLAASGARGRGVHGLDGLVQGSFWIGWKGNLTETHQLCPCSRIVFFGTAYHQAWTDA